MNVRKLSLFFGGLCFWLSLAIATAQVPVINSFSPASGPIGTTVTLAGANFSPVPLENIVYFGAVRASVLSAATDSLAVSVPAGATYKPITVTTGALTGSSKVPFVVTFPSSRELTFAGSANYSTDDTSPDPTFLMGDLDGDGKPDVIGTGTIRASGNGTTTGALLLFRNASTPGTLGPGSLTSFTKINPDGPNLTMSAAGAAVADLDGDGKLDLILLENNPPSLLIYRNISTTNGLDSTSFASPAVISTPTAIPTRHGIGIADLDGDGRPDILLCDYGGLAVFRNLASPGNISSNSFAPAGNIFTNSTPFSIATADFDLDGRPDVSLITTGSEIALLRNVSSGPGISNNIFADPVTLVFPQNQSPVAILTADMDGDGRMDLLTYAVNNNSSTETAIFRNLSSDFTAGSFEKQVQISGPYYGSIGTAVAGDLDGDGKLDIAILTPRPNVPDSAIISSYLNRGSVGSLNSTSFVAQPSLFADSSYPPYEIGLADVDGDGKNDVVMWHGAFNGGSVPKGYFTVYQNLTPLPSNALPVITLTAPTNGASYITPADILITAEASDSDGAIVAVNFFSGTNLIGTVTNEPYALTWTNVAVGNYTLTARAVDDLGAITTSAPITVVVNPVPIPPSITTQPHDQSIGQGSNATFTVRVSGTAPLSYQWTFNGNNLLGATSSNLLISGVQFSNAGTYAVVVTNIAGSVTSNPAILSVIPEGGRLVHALDASTSPGSQVAVAIELLGQGNENALSFSIAFPPTVLAYASAQLGVGASNALLNVNDSETASGRLGLSLALSADQTLSSGTQQLAVVTFNVAAGIGNTVANISFGDQPLSREISDTLANVLGGSYLGSTVSIVGAGYEADVTPLQDGNGVVSVTDWIKIGRYAAKLDTIPSPSQFQRADCAPRSTLGNGSITTTDWVQAGRYAAGLDPLTPAGGPTASTGPSLLKLGGAGGGAALSSAREVRIPRIGLRVGQTNRVPIVLLSQGNESAVGFSLNFDPSMLTFVSVAAGTNASTAVLNANNSQATNGQIGVVLSLPIGTNTFAAGTQEVAVVRFVVSSNAVGTLHLDFGDRPVASEVSDAFANTQSANYVNGLLPVAPSLRISRAGSAHILSWPAWASNALIDATDTLSSTPLWQPPSVTASNVVSGEIRVTVPITGAQSFFRLRLP